MLLDSGGWDETHPNGRELAAIVRLRVRVAVCASLDVQVSAAISWHHYRH